MCAKCRLLDQRELANAGANLVGQLDDAHVRRALLEALPLLITLSVSAPGLVQLFAPADGVLLRMLQAVLLAVLLQVGGTGDEADPGARG